ncbi:MAG: DegT/DnrJ/EryC1/StrS family aminotransferase [Thermoplasmata archaeon]
MKEYMRIPLFRPYLGDEEIEEIRETFRTGWVGLGPKTLEFERRLSEFTGARHVICTNSCTSALHLALFVLGVKGKEVLLPSLTFVATAHAVLHAGGKPVWVDVDEETLCMSTGDLRKKLGRKSACIIPVHYAGHPCEMEEILEVAKEKEIHVVEDAAQALGGEYRGKRIGSLDSTMTCFSFHATKNITTGEGGAITTNSDELNIMLRQYRFLGADRDTWTRLREAKEKYWHFVCENVGYKYYMNDVAAAIGIAQIRKLPEILERKTYLFNRYTEKLKGIPEVRVPTVLPHVKTSAYSYVIKCERRDELMAFLAARGITTGVHYMPVHLQPAYRNYKGKLMVTERVWQQILTLPLYYTLKEEEQDYIVAMIEEFYRRRQ